MDKQRMCHLLCSCFGIAGLIVPHMAEVAAKSLQGVTFLVNFGLGSNAIAAKDGQWWTPTLDRVLQQDRTDHERYNRKSSIHQ